MSDDGTINLRGGNDNDDDAEFKIERMEEEAAEVVSHEDRVFGNVEAVSVGEAEEAALNPRTRVKVKFDKFVNLIASHAYEEVFDQHVDDDIIVSTDLLTDLANAHEEKSDRKMPVIFLVGIILGVGLTWLLLKY
ncbi:MAG: hypothetical protein ABID64_02740 [Nitrospirota bacterium]